MELILTHNTPMKEQQTNSFQGKNILDFRLARTPKRFGTHKRRTVILSSKIQIYFNHSQIIES